jgi:dephospho-CoA kinase
MLKAGITGGIGSGKSTVCQVFETLGIPVFYADAAAKYLMEKNEKLQQQIIELFGAEAYQNGHLNRSHISKIVFSDKEKLARLNSITHPAVIQYGEEWMKKQTTPYALKEAAIFFESGSNKKMDVMIGISAPLHLRIQRSMQRDHISEEAVLERISKQMNEEEKMQLCDYVIINDDKTSVIEQVLHIHQKLLQQTITSFPQSADAT